ncbi:hypothetical protein JK364_23295 [Streptomyces sp. 110]|uniref:HTH luxR-type domain-containing protein n=1 Tax=Streptomyces endocoffeicus TaxID=2898945 RepID=A0ABS1PTD2_9ACTN|nr:hypothetical protein [Streptomyces endocoffeicus]
MTPSEAAAEMGVCTAMVNRCLRDAMGKLRSPELPGLVDRAYGLGELDPPELSPVRVIVQPLTSAEWSILLGLADGRNLEEIAAGTGFYLPTVRQDLHALMKRMGAKTVSHLIMRAWEFGLRGAARKVPAPRGSSRGASRGGEARRCPHQPLCPAADAPDREAAHLVAHYPEQGWSLLCNGVLQFEDTGELLPDGRIVSPHRPLAVEAT